jgi:hypothetical protein
VDYHCELRLFVTASRDSRVKVWNTSKILIYEVVVDDTLQHALWTTRSHLLIFMANKMYCLRHSLSISLEELRALDRQFREDFDIDYTTTLDQYVH